MGQAESSVPDAANGTALTTARGVDATIHFDFLAPDLRKKIDAWFRSKGWLAVAIGGGCIAVAISIKAIGSKVPLGEKMHSLATAAASWGATLVVNGLNVVQGANAHIAN